MSDWYPWLIQDKIWQEKYMLYFFLIALHQKVHDVILFLYWCCLIILLWNHQISPLNGVFEITKCPVELNFGNCVNNLFSKHCSNKCCMTSTDDDCSSFKITIYFLGSSKWFFFLFEFEMVTVSYFEKMLGKLCHFIFAFEPRLIKIYF